MVFLKNALAVSLAVVLVAPSPALAAILRGTGARAVEPTGTAGSLSAPAGVVQLSLGGQTFAGGVELSPVSQAAVSAPETIAATSLQAGDAAAGQFSAALQVSQPDAAAARRVAIESTPSGSSSQAGSTGADAAKPDAAGVLPELTKAVEARVPAAELFDKYGRRVATVGNDVPVYHSFLHGREAGSLPAASAALPRVAPAALAAAVPAEPATLGSIVDAWLGFKKLDDGQRAALESFVKRARDEKDLGLLANLTFISLHDARGKGVVTQALRAMAANYDARAILDQETRSLSSPFSAAQRAEMASRARDAAARYETPVRP
ncbi:MAG TPA: hypothetical protein VNI01_00550 [Elusimicrobiota bacterium]|nr:hypothetical protein [Elusimicrobiota bacterium]